MVMEMFRNQVVEMVAHCEYAKNHSVVYLKKVNFMLCELHLNFKNMKKNQ